MEHRIEQRLEELRKEMAEGNALLKDLQQRTHSVNQRMLRISGAIQVLEELQTDVDKAASAPPLAVGQ